MRRRTLLAAAGMASVWLVGCARPGLKQRAEESGERLRTWLSTAPQVATIESITPRTNDLARPWADATITPVSTLDRGAVTDFIASFYEAVDDDYWSVRVQAKVGFSVDTEPRTNTALPRVWSELNGDPAVISGRVIHGTDRLDFDLKTTANPLEHLLDLLSQDWMTTWVKDCSLSGPDEERNCSYSSGPVVPDQAAALRELAQRYLGPSMVELIGTGEGTITLRPPPADRDTLQEWLKTWRTPGSVQVTVV